MTTKEIPPADLLLDEQNPRFARPVQGQREALEAMARLHDSKLVALANDIVDHRLDPSTLPMVIRSDALPPRYTVLEGNRRLAALRALEDPGIVAGAVKSTTLKKLRALSRRYQADPIEKVTCVVMPDRDEAQHWVELRHTGENNGAGVLRWGSEEASRLKARGGTTEIHSQALDFLEAQGALTSEARGDVPVTSLRRLLGTPQFRECMGLGLKNRLLTLRADPPDAARALAHVVEDLITGHTKTRHIYTTEQRQQYAANLPSHIVVTPTIDAASAPPISSVPRGTEKTKRPRVTRRAKARDRLIPDSCSLSVSAERTKNIETELRGLSLTRYTNSVSVLFRVFLELSVSAYITRHSIGLAPRATLSRKIREVADHLVSRNMLSEGERKPALRACQRDSFLAPSVSLMHQFVHNEHMFPAPADLRAHWDNLQPFVIAMWKH